MTIRSAAQIAIGLVYAIGALFNGLYTRRHGPEFYGEFADRAWLSPAGSFIRRLIVPNSVVFTVLLIAFQATIAVAILSRGEALGPALVIGGVFAFVVALFSSPGGAVGNLLLAGMQFWLA